MSIESYPNPNGVLTSLIWRKTMSGAETSLSGYDNASQALSYTPGQEQVYLNGILLVRGDDYTATNGTSITGLSALAASDFVQINCYNNFSVASVPAASLTGTVTNAQLANSAITINGSAISLGGTVTLAGDIESVTAGTGLTGGGNSGAVTLTLDSSSVISPTIVNAKGDILTATADNVPAILTVGNSGEILVADSNATSGLRYQTGYNGNAIINGGMDIFQRSSTPTTGISAPGTNAVYALDRWQLYRNTTGSTMSRQVTGDTTNLPQIQYCGRTQRTVSTSSTAAIYNSYTLETTDSIRFAGQVVTFSFYARAGANYSAASSGLVYALRYGTGTDQNNLDGFTGNTNVVSSTITLTTTWQRFQGTATVSSTATQLGILFISTPVGTAGANDYFEITGVQLELGSIATTFKRSNGAGGTIQGELSACQRYYYRTTSAANSNPAYTLFCTGFATSTTGILATVNLPVAMRIAPTALDTSAMSTFYSEGGNTWNTPTSVSIGGSTQNNLGQIVIVKSGFTSGANYLIFSNNSTAAFLGFTAEL